MGILLGLAGHLGQRGVPPQLGRRGLTDRDRDRFFGYHEACWKRNLDYKKANRILAKTSMLTFRLDEVLIQRYPDCKLVYIIRDPVEVIPPGMSLVSGVLDNGYDTWNRTTEDDQSGGSRTSTRPSCEMLSTFHEKHTIGTVRTETCASSATPICSRTSSPP